MKQLTKEDWLHIAREYGNKGPTALGDEFNVSKQRIQQIATRLRKEGIEVARWRGMNGHLATILAFVKENLK